MRKHLEGTGGGLVLMGVPLMVFTVCESLSFTLGT